MTKKKTLKEVIQTRLHKALKGRDYEVVYNGNPLQVVKCDLSYLQTIVDLGLSAQLRDDTIEVYDIGLTKVQRARIEAKAKEKLERAEGRARAKIEKAEAKEAIRNAEKIAAREAKKAAYGFSDFSELIPDDWGSTSHADEQANRRRSEQGFSLDETYEALNETP